ncbi:MAG: adenine deaminase [Candidatus Syntrophonatronum acetioxidans]|uniref:Adenine deaminase n=1 Tax=Candidatus Syntrophonatronum acetioxidans TaxID=1795816 RepID=A0A424YD63_9FIRM|nr:MAG: adenine deaminase [Candidatus Syntrophonatronum acetioxidans]
MEMEAIIKAARGEVLPDLLLANALVVNVFTGEVLEKNVALKNGLIAGVGDYDQGEEVFDLEGKYLIPGLLDAHIHLESTMLNPENFARAALLHGTTAVVADPHEIVNAAGMEGLFYMLEASRDLPLDIYYTIPSCVPATHMETAGGHLSREEIEEAFEIYRDSPALGEMMNFPGVCFQDPQVMAKLKAARERNKLIDGHAPLLGGKDLNAYISGGITTDHECTHPEEALEKLRLGMKILIREGSAARNLLDLLPLINEKNAPHIMFCCDDRHPGDLLYEGEIDQILRKGVGAGLDPVLAVRTATLNTASHYGLSRLGAVAPGYQGDLVVVNNLQDFQVEKVFKRGRLVVQGGEILWQADQKVEGKVSDFEKKLLKTVQIPDLEGKLSMEVPPSVSQARVIQVFPQQILTSGLLVSREEVMEDREISRVAVVERYGKKGNVALGLVKGFGPLKGALASTVAHDSHNLIIVGQEERDMEAAALKIAEMGGGLVVVSGGEVLADLPLPLGGIMSREEAVVVAARHEKLLEKARQIGVKLPSPFMTMSFLALPVIPQLRITDRGLVDVDRFQFVDLWLKED